MKTPWEDREDTAKAVLVWIILTVAGALFVMYVLSKSREMDDLKYTCKIQEEVIANLRAELGVVKDLKIDMRKARVAHMVGDGDGMEVYVVWKGAK